MANKTKKLKSAPAEVLHLELQDFANIVQFADEAIIIYESRRIIFANDKALEMSSMSRDEFIGSDIFAFIPEEDREKIANRVVSRETGVERSGKYEIQLLDKAGAKHDYLISSNLLEIQGKHCVLCFLSDISVQKRVAAALLKSEAKYRSLIEESNDAIMLSDQQGNFYEVNQRTADMFGYTKQELLGMNFKELVFSKDIELKPLRLDELSTGQIVTTQRELRRKDGSEFTAEVSGKSLPDGTIQGSVRDLSERKDAEKRLRLIVEGTSNTIGEDFLKDLAKSLATALEVKYVLITEKNTDIADTAFPQVLWADGSYEEMPEYDIKGTPAELVWNQKQIHTSQTAAKDHPKDKWMRAHKIVSYIGMPLIDSRHRLIGHLAVMDDKPMDDLIVAESIMRIFGSRAGSELERKLLERMWKRYEFIVNSSKDLMTLISKDYRYEAVNDAHCIATKLTREQIVGKTVSEVWGNTTFEHVIKTHLESCFQDKEFHEQAWIQPSSYSRPGFFDISYYPYHDIKGNVSHAIVVSRDITDRKEAELELQYRLEFEKLITSLSTHFINLDNTEIEDGIQKALQEIGEFTGVNHCFIFLDGSDSNKFEFKYLWNTDEKANSIDKWKAIDFADFPWAFRMIQRQRTVVIPNPEILPPEEHLLKEVLVDAGIKSLILVPIVYDRKVKGLVGFAVEAEGKSLPANADSILRIVGEMFGNALDRKLTGEKLSQLYDMQSKLFSSIAHSLKTPFTVILGNVNMLERNGYKTDDSRELLNGIKGNISMASEKITQLLKVAQLDMSPTHSTDEILEIDPVITKITSQAKYLFQAYYPGNSKLSIDKHLRLNVTSGAKINADEKSITDLVLTLLDNAFKHSPKPDELPDVEVTTKLEDEQVVITIADKGKGIAKEHQPHVFDLYYQVDNKHGGFGIGLAFCKKMSEALGGSIAVSSEVDKGTTFTIKLPQAS